MKAYLCLALTMLFVLLTSCASDNETPDEVMPAVIDEYDGPEYSSSAECHQYDADNLLELKGIIIDEDTLIYEFEKSSPFIEAMRNDTRYKPYLFVGEEGRENDLSGWEIVENEKSDFLVLNNCETGERKLHLVIRNDWGDWKALKGTIIYSIRIETGTLRLIIDDARRNGYSEIVRKQFYSESKQEWEEIEEERIPFEMPD